MMYHEKLFTIENGMFQIQEGYHKACAIFLKQACPPAYIKAQASGRSCLRKMIEKKLINALIWVHEPKNGNLQKISPNVWIHVTL